MVTNKVVNGDTYSDNAKTLALGGLTDGVYNYELCSAYAAIANNGVYNKPTLYTKVLDHDGNVLLDGTGESHQAIKDSTAGLLTSALQTVVEEGTGKACQLDNMPVAGKQVQQHPTRIYGLSDIHHITHVLYGAVMMITKNVILTLNSVSASGKES